MDDDTRHAMKVLNRPKIGPRNPLPPPSPGDLADSAPPSGRFWDRGGDTQPVPRTDDDGEGGIEAFDPASSDYKAYGRADNLTLPSLRLIFKDGSEKACLYSQLDSNGLRDGCEFIPSSADGRGNVIRLRFAGHSAVFLVIIEGLRLRRVWELIMGHQTPWIHELSADAPFLNGNDPVIRSITIKEVKEGR
jgi:hypothetical protein